MTQEQKMSSESCIENIYPNSSYAGFGILSFHIVNQMTLIYIKLLIFINENCLIYVKVNTSVQVVSSSLTTYVLKDTHTFLRHFLGRNWSSKCDHEAERTQCPVRIPGLEGQNITTNFEYLHLT